jgi:two-component system LytT family response regulator
MNCIIVDNEPNAIKKLSVLITDNFTDVTIAATCTTISTAVKAIHEHNPDFIFLDVELNGETGFDVFNHFSVPQFNVVFTTAHEKYALRAIKASCFEFLLKPIQLSELAQVIDKLRLKLEKDISKKLDILQKNINAGKNFNQIAVPTQDEFHFINTNNIVCLEADAKYTCIYTIDGDKHLSSKNIGDYEEILNEEDFFRCHKSWIVNLKHAKTFVKNTNVLVLNNDVEVEVSTRKKDEFLRRFFKP